MRQDRQHRFDHMPSQANSLEVGSVSVEFALGLVGIMSVFALILGGLDAAYARSQACQLARDGARQAALAAQEGGAGLAAAVDSRGSVTIQRDGQWVWAHAQWPLHSPVDWVAPAMSCDIQTLAEPAQ